MQEVINKMPDIVAKEKILTYSVQDSLLSAISEYINADKTNKKPVNVSILSSFSKSHEYISRKCFNHISNPKSQTIHITRDLLTQIDSMISKRERSKFINVIITDFIEKLKAFNIRFKFCFSHSELARTAIIHYLIDKGLFKVDIDELSLVQCPMCKVHFSNRKKRDKGLFENVSLGIKIQFCSNNCKNIWLFEQIRKNNQDK